MICYFESIVLPTIKDVCKKTILKEFNANFDNIKTK